MTEPPQEKTSGRETSGRLGRRAAAAYQGAIEAVLAVVITTGAGYWLDQRFDTAPTFLLSGIVIGFCSFALRLWRLRHLMEATPEEAASGGGSASGGAKGPGDRDRDEPR